MKICNLRNEKSVFCEIFNLQDENLYFVKWKSVFCEMKNLYFAKWATSSSVSWFSDNFNSNVRYIFIRKKQKSVIKTFRGNIFVDTRTWPINQEIITERKTRHEILV